MRKSIVIGMALLSLVGCQEKPTTQPTPVATTPAVSASATPDGEMSGALQADVQLDRDTYLPGDQIEVMAVAVNLDESAWVGIVPSSVPHGEEKTNDDNDLGYVRVNSSDSLYLVAPNEKPGSYDVRLNDNDESGKELASRTFKLEVDPNPVKEPKLLLDESANIVAGQEFTVKFEAPLDYESNAWIGVIPTDTAHGEEAVGDSANLGYQYLYKRSRGYVKLTAPTAAGEYDIRMYDKDDSGKEVVSVTVTVAEK